MRHKPELQLPEPQKLPPPPVPSDDRPAVLHLGMSQSVRVFTEDLPHLEALAAITDQNYLMELRDDARVVCVRDLGLDVHTMDRRTSEMQILGLEMICKSGSANFALTQKSSTD